MISRSLGELVIGRVEGAPHMTVWGVFPTLANVEALYVGTLGTPTVPTPGKATHESIRSISMCVSIM
jgi:hypothetical protein